VPRPASDIRERILHAARARFLREGVDGASLRGVAHDAGTNIGMVYYYFKTKDELFLGVVDEVYTRFLADLTAALAPDRAAPERLRRLYQRMAQLGADELDVVRLVMREALVSSARLGELARRFQHGHVPLVLQTLRDGVSAGDFDAETNPVVTFVATLLLALMPQLLHRQVTAAELPFVPLLPSREEAAHALCDVLMFGIAAPKAKRRATKASTGGREHAKNSR
jgi:AcrR family transcriptional regulator